MFSTTNKNPYVFHKENNPFSQSQFPGQVSKKVCQVREVTSLLAKSGVQLSLGHVRQIKIMNMLQNFIILFMIGCVGCVTQPPIMLSYPKTRVPFKDGETVSLLCVATGDPQPTYRWVKDGDKFDSSGFDDRWVMIPNSGNLVCNKPEKKDVGLYQCFASNAHGVAMSLMYDLRQAFLDDFAKEKSQTIQVSLGHPVKLNCIEPSSFPDAVMFWVLKYKDGGFEAIDYDDRVTMDLEGRLIITNVEKKDYQNGRAYACMAMNTFVRTNTQGKEYYIIPTGSQAAEMEPRRMWASPSELSFELGETARMKCIWVGNPTPEVFWTRNNQQLSDSKYQLYSFGQELRINNLQFEDAGNYECSGRNKLTQTSPNYKIFVSVYSKPQWIRKPQNVESSVGGSATFICDAESQPSPDVRQWFIDGVLTSKKNLDVNKYFISSTNLTIVNLIKEDAMTIQCNISNKYGYVFTNAYLNVLEEKPEFVKAPEAQMKASEGQNTNLSCQTAGQPKPQVLWYKDGKQITGGRYRTLSNGDLYIQNLVVADAGDYSCIAKNRYGEVSGSGRLIIRRQTRIEQVPLDLEANAGTDAKFTCAGTTDPMEVSKLTITWLKDDKPITTGEQRMAQNFQDNSLTISGITIRDAGRYTCVASNGLDEARASAMLTVRAKPESPSSVKVQFWKRGYKEETFQDYSFYLDTTPFYGRSRRSTGPPISLNLQHLYPNSRIEVQVLVMNTYYVSRPSDMVSFETFEGVPGPVPFLIASVRGSNHFLLKWDKPTDSNGVITGYDIAFQTVIGLNLGKMRDREPQIHEPELKQIRLSGLKSFQLYRVYIWARTRIGRGEPYYIDVATTKPGVPNAPTFSFVHIDYTYVNISWPIHKNTDLHGSVYYVEFRKEGASDWQQSTDESVLSWKKIANLETGTSYEFRLVATNGQETRPSAIQVATTHGYFVGFAGTSAWLYGMLVALLIIICAAIILFVTRKKIAERRQKSYQKNMRASKTNVGNAPEFEDERGYNNDYHDGFNDSFKKSQSTITPEADNLPPSYNDVKGYDDHHYKNDRQYDDRYYDQEGYDDQYYDEHGEYDPNYEYPEYDDQYEGHYEDYDYRYNSKNDVHYEEPVPSKKKEYLDWGEASGTNDTCV
ncbi:NRCAM [Acanthosepion pharaonis]|uniref:NRCAM n=1 Tax=Acanthosepion pharaonis TaxID=158019 RepID=A0A812DRD1_ACAPH|nr:NRCAM [Sepia pharaonis]